MAETPDSPAVAVIRELIADIEVHCAYRGGLTNEGVTRVHTLQRALAHVQAAEKAAKVSGVGLTVSL